MTFVINIIAQLQSTPTGGHRLCSQLAIAQLQSTPTGVVTGCVPNWRSHNCRALLQAVTGCVPNWRSHNCRALPQAQSQAVFPTGDRTTAEHSYRRSHRLCSQLAIAKLQSTPTGVVTGCVPNWRSHNCRALLQAQSQAVFPTGDRTTAEHSHRRSYRLCPELAIAQLLDSPIYQNQN